MAWQPALARRTTASGTTVHDPSGWGRQICGYGLINALLVALPFLLAKNVLLDLSGGGLGQIAKGDRARAFEMGDALAAELDDLLSRRLHPKAWHHEGLGHLSPALIRHADHAHLEHGRVLHDHLFHLLGGDVLSAGDDDVLGTIFQFD